MPPASSSSRVSSSEKRRSARADLGQLAGQAQAMQPEPRVLAGRQHDPQHAAAARLEEALEQAQRLRRAQLVEVVDDEHDAARRASAGRTAGARRRPRRGTPAWRRRARRAARSPTAPASASTTDSQNRCASSSPRSTETQATRSERPGLDPRSQQDRLAAAGRRADEQHARPGRRRTAHRTAAAGHQPAPAGSDRRWRARAAAASRGRSAVSARIVMTIRTRPCSSDPARRHASGAEP